MGKLIEIIKGIEVEISIIESENLIRGEGASTTYFIPLELRNIHPSDSRVHPRTLRKYLRILGMENREYYNLYFLRKSRDYLPECRNQYCKNKVRFNRVTRGYHIYCSKSCRSQKVSIDLWKDEDYWKRMEGVRTDMWNNPYYVDNMSSLSKSRWKDSEYREMMREGLVTRWKDSEYRDAMIKLSISRWEDITYRSMMTQSSIDRWKNINYISMMAKSTADQWKDPKYAIPQKIGISLWTFISRGRIEDICQFYIGIQEESELIKFGITNGDVPRRVRDNKLRTVHVVREGTREYIGNLEAYIKTCRNDPEEFTSHGELRLILDLISKYDYEGFTGEK